MRNLHAPGYRLVLTVEHPRPPPALGDERGDNAGHFLFALRKAPRLITGWSTELIRQDL